MIFCVDREVFVRYPGYLRVLVVGRGLANPLNPPPEALVLLRTAESLVRVRPDLHNPALHDRIACWRAAFADFGARPGKYLSSLEALVRRVRRGDPLPVPSTLAALVNAASLHYLLPACGHDIGRARGPALRLGFATGHERFRAIGASEAEAESPEPGEVVYADGDAVMCRRWCWRQADHTRLTSQTAQVAVSLDVLPPVTRAEAEAAASELATSIQRFCGGELCVAFLDAEHPRVEA